MAKKLQKAKRPGMSPKTKFTLVNVFKSLISNQAAIDGSKESAWWIAAIFLVLSVILPLVPNFISLSNANGASFVSSYNYGLDSQMTAFAYTMKQEGVELKVEGGKLHYYENDVEKPEKFVELDETYCGDYSRFDKEYRYVNTVTGQVDVRVFCLSDTNLKTTVNKLVKQYYKVNTVLGPTEDPDEKHYLPNIVIFTPTTFAVAVYKSNTTTQAGSSYGGLNWFNTSKKVGLIERLLGDGVDDTSKSLVDFINTYRDSSFKQFKKICTETYLSQKTKTKWQTTGIYAGIYAGIIVFLGLMVFILTRGKYNPYKHVLNVWHCQKIVWWASLSPAILGTILALIFSGNSIGQMAFILLVSLRMMWLAMKQLKPEYAPQQ